MQSRRRCVSCRGTWRAVADERVQGIQFFIQAGMLPSRDPHDVAKFLHETSGLSKAAIGEYLGEV